MTRTDTSRRSVLKAVAAFGTAVGFSGLAAAQDDETEAEGEGDEELPEGVTLIRLGGNTEAWEGREPEDIADEENPTLELTEGETYVVEWENVDGAPHNFAILNSEGDPIPEIQPLQNNTAAEDVTFENVTVADTDMQPEDGQEDGDGEEAAETIEATETIEGEGQVQTLQFTATEEMDQYLCQVHPNTMVGDIEITDEGGLGSEEGDGGGEDGGGGGEDGSDY